MIIILLIGGITYEETEDEINIKETEEITHDTTQTNNKYIEKYIELYKNKHEPHNKHNTHKKYKKKKNKLKINNKKKST